MVLFLSFGSRGCQCFLKNKVRKIAIRSEKGSTNVPGICQGPKAPTGLSFQLHASDTTAERWPIFVCAIRVPICEPAKPRTAFELQKAGSRMRGTVKFEQTRQRLPPKQQLPAKRASANLFVSARTAQFYGTGTCLLDRASCSSELSRIIVMVNCLVAMQYKQL